MTIGIAALQSLPEVEEAPPGLLPPTCRPGTLITCVKPTCRATIVSLD